MLRAFATESGGSFDVDAAYLARQQSLPADPAGDNKGAAGGAGAASLRQRLLGGWDKGAWRRELAAAIMPSSMPPLLLPSYDALSLTWC